MSTGLLIEISKASVFNGEIKHSHTNVIPEQKLPFATRIELRRVAAGSADLPGSRPNPAWLTVPDNAVWAISMKVDGVIAYARFFDALPEILKPHCSSEPPRRDPPKTIIHPGSSTLQ